MPTSLAVPVDHFAIPNRPSHAGVKHELKTRWRNFMAYFPWAIGPLKTCIFTTSKFHGFFVAFEKRDCPWWLDVCMCCRRRSVGEIFTMNGYKTTILYLMYVS